MEEILLFIEQNVAIAPYLIFGLLLLAGFNLPISEDGMLFVSGIIAAKNPDQAIPLFIGVFSGAYGSDLIAYSLGRFFGPKLLKIKWFSSMVGEERLTQVNSFYAKYGVVTLILGRFIPFGVRNALFIAAGLGKMSPVRFALSDGLACIISTTTFFYLYYTYGESVISAVKQGNMVIFGLAACVVIGVIIKKKFSKKV